MEEDAATVEGADQGESATTFNAGAVVGLANLSRPK